MRKLLAKIKLWILTISIPFQKWFQRRGRREPLMTEAQVNRIEGKAMPGDILLSFEYQRWTSRFIKGFYDHAVILSSRGTIIEAVGDKIVDGKNVGGVREVPLRQWLFNKDYVALIRVNHASAFAAGMNALKYIGRRYDYRFKHDNEDVYCSELPYLSWRIEWDKFLAEFEGDEILPQLYLDYSKHGIAPYLECLVDTRG